MRLDSCVAWQWGDRRDRDFSASELTQIGFSAQPSQPGEDELVHDGGKTLVLHEHTFLVHTHKQNVLERAALGRLLAGRLPFPAAEAKPCPEQTLDQPQDNGQDA